MMESLIDDLLNVWGPAPGHSVSRCIGIRRHVALGACVRLDTSTHPILDSLLQRLVVPAGRRRWAGTRKTQLGRSSEAWWWGWCTVPGYTWNRLRLQLCSPCRVLHRHQPGQQMLRRHVMIEYTRAAHLVLYIHQAVACDLRDTPRAPMTEQRHKRA